MARQTSQEPSRPLFQNDEERRVFVEEEGKKWAQSVNAENAWDKLVLTFGKIRSLLLNSGGLEVNWPLRISV